MNLYAYAAHDPVNNIDPTGTGRTDAHIRAVQVREPILRRAAASS